MADIWKQSAFLLAALASSIIATISHTLVTLWVPHLSSAIRRIEGTSYLTPAMQKLLVGRVTILGRECPISKSLQGKLALVLYGKGDRRTTAASQLTSKKGCSVPRTTRRLSEAHRLVLHASLNSLLR
jgi:hypothetical protein